jgi:hypothetical protein
MLDPFSIFWHVVIATTITVLIGYIFKWRPSHNYIEIAVLFTGLYICISKLTLPAEKLNMPLKELVTEPTVTTTTTDMTTTTLPTTTDMTTTTTTTTEPPYHPRSGVDAPLFKGIRVDDGTFPDSVQKYYDTEIPIMGPLDGLNPTDMNSRLSYLYRKTATPYKPMTYFDFVSDSDKLLQSAGKYQVLNGPTQSKARSLDEYRVEMERWYPTMSKNQINERDCTNFAPGSPGSCLIKPVSLLDGAGKKLVEKFENYTSQPRAVDTLRTMPILFKNAPDYLNLDDSEIKADISHNIGRGGKYGVCRSDYCGSRVLEPGNNNIVGVNQMFKAYLTDNVN